MIRTPSAPGELKTYRNVSETAEHCSVRSVLSFQGEISRIFCTIYIYIDTRTKPGIPTRTFEGQPELLEGGGSRTVRLELRDQQVTLRASRARASVPGPL